MGAQAPSCSRKVKGRVTYLRHIEQITRGDELPGWWLHRSRPGPVAFRLNLEHFEDDQMVNLDCVRAVLGRKCLQFTRNGLGDQQSPAGQLGSVPYPIVPNWGHLLCTSLGSCRPGAGLGAPPPAYSHQ